MSKQRPHVTIVTPVYNGGAYIAECIESVIAQHYANWQYIIVNNCSSDNTLALATRYAEKDDRIRIVTNTTFVGVIENHNIAFQQLAPESRYCKLVSADDWIYPECLDQLVDVAEKHPSAGIVGSYSTTGKDIAPRDIPLRDEVFSGQSICRMHLLGKQVFSALTASLFRADLIRGKKAFLTVAAPNADTHEFLKVLQHHDYGFVHQILSFVRVHDQSVSGKLMKFNSFLVNRIEYLVTYGSLYLSPHEYENRRTELLAIYYGFLADRTLRFAGNEFWEYHRRRMTELGHPISHVRLAGAVCSKIVDLVGNPKQTIETALRRLRRVERPGE